jgi:hypothetical protein
VFVGAADDHPGASWININYSRLREHGVELEGEGIERVPFYDAREDGRPNYRCHHCGKHGSNIHYFCFFLHKPTKQVIVVGQICAKKADLASREELDFQKSKAYRQQAKLREWIKHHKAEYDFLREYDEQHAENGFFVEFFSSLWEKLQRFGYLTEGQLAGLGRWMERGKPWTKVRPQPRNTNDEPQQLSFDERYQRPVTPEKKQELREAFDPDRHQAEVTHVDEEPTEAQVDYLYKLANELDATLEVPQTRIEASNLINVLKGKVIAKREQERPASNNAMLATSKQLSFINALMDERKLTLEQRREARRRLDSGLTREQAKAWIERLKELPKLLDNPE